jgi:hypothetical protein
MTISLCVNFSNHISRTFLNHSSHWFKLNDVYNGMIISLSNRGHMYKLEKYYHKLYTETITTTNEIKWYILQGTGIWVMRLRNISNYSLFFSSWKMGHISGILFHIYFYILTRRVSLVEQELLTLPEHLS